jgi:CDP-diacylglycerol--serine O-phosphatidyltransferase
MTPTTRETNGIAEERRERAAFRASRNAFRLLPTLFTMGNLMAGFSAIYFAAKPSDISSVAGLSTLTIAGLLIFIGMLFDTVDGTLARLTNSTSDLGAQLDSLADVVTCGVAPAFIMLRLVGTWLHDGQPGMLLGPERGDVLGRLVWGAAIVYVCCTALRLARFNVETISDEWQDHLYFRGLPSPGAAGVVASLVLLHEHWMAVPATTSDIAVKLAYATALLIPVISITCAIAMVTSLPYAHVINRSARDARSAASIAKLLIPMALAIWWLQETLAAVFTIYALSAPITALRQKMRSTKRTIRDTLTDSHD